MRGMLSFVGLGLYDEHSVTVEGKTTIADADRAFAECYTSKLAGAALEDLESYYDIQIEVRDRGGVEQNPGPILDAAESEDVVFLVVGDPMIATTHVDLRLRAYERGIETRVIHGTTAQTAASSLTGLQNYRFGKSTTLPFPESRNDGSVPESVWDTIVANQARDLHTIVYLDIDAEADAFLSASDASSALAEQYNDMLGVVVAQAGSPNPVVVANSLSALADRSFGDPLHLLVLPGALHPLEADALVAFADAPATLLTE